MPVFLLLTKYPIRKYYLSIVNIQRRKKMFFVCLFLGYLGIHKLIERKYGMCLLYIMTVGLFGIGWIYDCIKYAINGQFGFSKPKTQQTTQEKIAAKRTNFAGESMDRLDAEGNLPFGWVVHNKKYVDMIENDMQPFRQAIWDATTDLQKYGALKSYMLFLHDGKKHYTEMDPCVGKYFEEYICNSCETECWEKELRELERKRQRQE